MMPTWDELTKEQRLRIVRLMQWSWSAAEEYYIEVQKIVTQMPLEGENDK